MTRNTSEASRTDSFFDDRNAMLLIWKEKTRAKNGDLQLIWRVTEIFIAMFSALIAIDTIGLGLVVGQNDSVPTTAFYAILLVPSVFIVFLALIGEQELRRRFYRVAEKDADLTKLEALMGMNERIKDRIETKAKQPIGNNCIPFETPRVLFGRWCPENQKPKSDTSSDNESKKPSEDIWVYEEILLKKNCTYSDLRLFYYLFGAIGLIFVWIPLYLFCLESNLISSCFAGYHTEISIPTGATLLVFSICVYFRERWILEEEMKIDDLFKYRKPKEKRLELLKKFRRWRIERKKSDSKNEQDKNDKNTTREQEEEKEVIDIPQHDEEKAAKVEQNEKDISKPQAKDENEKKPKSKR